MQTSKVHSQVLSFKDSFPEVAQKVPWDSSFSWSVSGKELTITLLRESVTMLCIKLELHRSVRSKFLIPNSCKDLFIVIMAQNVQLKQCWGQTMGHPQNVACNTASGSYFMSLLVNHLSLENKTTLSKRKVPKPLC